MTERKHIYIILAATILVYGSTIWHGFVWDDFIYIVGKSPIQQLANIPYFFRSDISGGTTFQEATPYYRPVLSTLTAFMYAAWGKTAAGYHIVNILASIGVSLLVYLVGLRFSVGASASLLASLFYTVHPVHAEPVAYLGGNGELLYTLLYLSALLLYLKGQKTPSSLAMAISGLCYLLGLMIKESTITLPAIILLFELIYVKAPAMKKFARLSYYLLITLCYLALRMTFVKAAGWEAYRLTDRIYTSFGIVAGYMKNTLAPFDLRVLYDMPVRFSFARQEVILPMLLILAAGAAIAYCGRRDRNCLFFGAWFFITLAPASGIPAILSPAPMADRYLCLPLVGAALLFGMLYERLRAGLPSPDKEHEPAHGRKPALIAVFCTILSILAVLTMTRVSIWKSHERFVRQMIDDAPGHYLGYDLMGTICGERGDVSRMARFYLLAKQKGIEKSLRWGEDYMNVGRTDEAIGIYERLARKFPDLPEAANGIGMAMLAKGDRGSAQRYFRAAVDRCPTCEQYIVNLKKAESPQ